MSKSRGERALGIDYVIRTWDDVDPDTLDKLDTKNSSREKDGTTVKCPSSIHPCRLQLWEVYVAAAILVLQPHSSVIFAHVKALCEHNDSRILCETILTEHLCVGTVSDEQQEINLYTFFDEYFHRKFALSFTKHSLHEYIADALEDKDCGRNGIPRVYLLSPHLQAFFLNAQFFEGQYDELLNAMRMYNLPVNDVLSDGDQEIGEVLDLEWDNVKLYDDPNLILKKHGGWAYTKDARHLTPKDRLVMRLTGLSLEQILAAKQVPDSPGRDMADGETGRRSEGTMARRRAPGAKGAKGDGEDSDGSGSEHPSDFDVDAEHPKVMPLGVTLCEMYLLLRGLLKGIRSGRRGRFTVVSDTASRNARDQHILAAAVLVDLYMRDQIDVFHWTLREGSVAVAYKLTKRRGIMPMNHFLDYYMRDLEEIFRNMHLPSHISAAPIWASLEERGIIENHRPSWERAHGCGYRHVDVWDFARPDLLLDLKEGYHLAARVLYDRTFEDPMDEEANDMLMYCYLLQQCFDMSMEAADGMSRVLQHYCSPFQKGEMYPPVPMVHSSTVCLGLIDRGYRIAKSKDMTLALEAADFNEAVMERLEERFFLSEAVVQSFDKDQSGELSKEEFIDGMRNLDVYKDFRKERVPDDVLRRIVTDLAERLFHEVDINMDGTLTPQELQVAFKRRRDDALKNKYQRQWVRRTVESFAAQMGIQPPTDNNDQARADAEALQKQERAQGIIRERRARGEWEAEMERPELRDEDVDVDTSFATYH